MVDDPFENLVAHQAVATQIVAVISSPMQAQGAGFALEEGVDALAVSPQPAMLEANSASKPNVGTSPENPRH